MCGLGELVFATGWCPYVRYATTSEQATGYVNTRHGYAYANVVVVPRKLQMQRRSRSSPYECMPFFVFRTGYLFSLPVAACVACYVVVWVLRRRFWKLTLPRPFSDLLNQVHLVGLLFKLATGNARMPCMIRS